MDMENVRNLCKDFQFAMLRMGRNVQTWYIVRQQERVELKPELVEKLLKAILILFWNRTLKY